MNNPLVTGRLNVLAQVIAIYSEDLDYSRSTQAERDTATILDALHTAILLSETAALARLVKPWLDTRLVGAMQRRGLEDEIAGTRLEAREE